MFHGNAFVIARAFQSDEIANEGEEEKEKPISMQGEKKELLLFCQAHLTIISFTTFVLTMVLSFVPQGRAFTH